MTYLTQRYNDLSVSYLSHLDGGGKGFGQDYLPVVRHLFGRVDRVFEFCAGPGFIGFSLLASGLCRSLCLSDVNPEAVAAARDTVRRNRLDGTVSVYHSDALDQIPNEEMWDLVVSNPPHFRNQYEGSIRHYDPDWSIHRKFYMEVEKHLQPGGTVLIQENFEGSDETDFLEMIRSGGLICEGAFMLSGQTRREYLDTYYFISSRRAADRVSLRQFSAGPLIDCNEPVIVVDVELSEDIAPEIRLMPFKRHRFRFTNRFGRDVLLLTFKVKLGVLPRFLRTFGTAPAGTQGTSFSFHLYPGRYVLKDGKTRKSLLRIVVD